MKLAGLKGVEKEVDFEFFSTVTQAKKKFKNIKCLSVADDCGSINIYIDDEGLFRGERHFMFGLRSNIVTMKKNELFDWLKTELPKIKPR